MTLTLTWHQAVQSGLQFAIALVAELTVLFTVTGAFPTVTELYGAILIALGAALAVLAVSQGVRLPDRPGDPPA